MKLVDWLRRLFGKRQSPREMVPFLDVEAGRVVRIPASELRPGTVQVRLQPSGEIVWALPEQLLQGEIRHPEFDESIREYIRKIQSVFIEHRPLSLAEWEDGFRRDLHPEREIAIWLHAADVYTTFMTGELDVNHRRDVFLCIMACMTTSPQTVWKVLRPEVLNQADAEQVVNRFFGNQARPDTAPDSAI